MIQFRDFEERDVQEVRNIFLRLREESAEVSFIDYTEEESIRKWLGDEKNLVYVALWEGSVVGVFKARRGEREHTEDKTHAAFLSCATDMEFRGRSIAKDLTLYGIERLREKGVKIARAYIYSDNKASINTILSCGFQFAGSVHMHHFDERRGIYVDDLIFHKIL